MLKVSTSRFSWTVFLVALVILFSCRAEKPPSTSRAAILSSLPGDHDISGWTRDGEAREFRGEDLYIYINGGAEIYQEYGFQNVSVQDYRNPDGKSVSLEIFEMAAPESAYGMYTFKISGKGREVSLGNDSEMESYYLNFWRGRFLVTLTGFDETPETVEALGQFGQAVDRHLPRSEGKKPGIVDRLPRHGLTAGSPKYLRGLLGLNSVYSFGTARGLDFDEGITGDYKGDKLLILRYGSSTTGEKAFEDLRTFLAASERFREVEDEESGLFTVLDRNDRSVSLTARGPFLAIAISPEIERNRSLLSQVSGEG